AERHGAVVSPFQDRDAGEIPVDTRVVRNLQPRQALVGKLLDAAAAGEVTGDVPRAVVEVAGVARPDVVAADVVPVQPEPSQPIDVRGPVDQIAAVGHLELVGATVRHEVLSAGSRDGPGVATTPPTSSSCNSPFTL